MPALAEARTQMEKALEALRREFGTVRTGKASAALLDTVRVEAYGGKMPLNQVASVSAPEPRMLVVQPWDRSLTGEIEKAIRSSDLGLNPASDGNLIRVPVPALTEERRREMVRLLHKLAEEARVVEPHPRQEANKDIKNRQHEHEIGEDEAHRQMQEVQKLTDEYVARVDEVLKHKEHEVMEV
jgi:ribosome recycling factor